MINHQDDRSLIYQVKLDSTIKNDARIIASQFIKHGSNVLDVGSACGDFGEFIKNNNHCNIYGFEFCQGSIDIANNKKVYENIYQVDLNNFSLNEYKHFVGALDYVAILDVLEHTLHPKEILKNLKLFLKEEGELIISLPNISFGDVKLQILKNDFNYTKVGILDETHIHFYTGNSIAEFFAQQGLEIVECKVTVSEFGGKYMRSFISNILVRIDPKSYVFQYVFRAKLRKNDFNLDLYSINKEVMNIRWGDIGVEIINIWKYKTIENLFPNGSKIRRLLKKIKNNF